MRIILRESDLKGTLEAVPSKSYTHRAIICAALAEGRSEIIRPLYCDDTNTTQKLASLMGAKIKRSNNLEIEGTCKPEASKRVFYCNGSGTSLRFFTALSTLVPGKVTLTGNASLRRRPMGELLNVLGQLGIKCSSEVNGGLPPITITGGGLNGGNVQFGEIVSSQYLSSLLLACPKAENQTVINLISELQSKPYVDITLDVLKIFGIDVNVSDDMKRFIIPPRQNFTAGKSSIPGDFSSAAFILAAGVLAGKVKLMGMDLGSKQGDKAIISILKAMGANIHCGKRWIEVERSELKAVTVDASQIPDLVPILSVLATQAEGETKIINAGRLRLKESDRLKSTTTELRKMGADIRNGGDDLRIIGRRKLKGALIDPHDDHRIAMACAVAALVAEGETVIDNMECSTKSYPTFVNDLRKLGVHAA
jgi:3-phosphoshikimate 1-carboxyvinyltransferase